MMGDLFDSPWKILIIALVIIVLFGSKKLPSAARSLGQSMRILKKEVQGLAEDEPEAHPPDDQAAAEAPAEITVGSSATERRVFGGGRPATLVLGDDGTK
jgi:sec-independent protein translocase protein TatA